MNIHFQESPILGTTNVNTTNSLGEKFFALMAHDQSTIWTTCHINVVSLWHHQYKYVHVQTQSPRNSVGIKGMWKQCVPGAPSPPPPPCLWTRLNTCHEAQITCYYTFCHLQNYMPSFSLRSFTSSYYKMNTYMYKFRLQINIHGHVVFGFSASVSKSGHSHLLSHYVFSQVFPDCTTE